jgi:hypothetical protein
MDGDGEEITALGGAPLPRPSLFVGGRLDASTTCPAALPSPATTGPAVPAPGGRA